MIRFEFNIISDAGQRHDATASARRTEFAGFQSGREKISTRRRVSFRGGIGFARFCPRCAGKKEAA